MFYARLCLSARNITFSIPRQGCLRSRASPVSPMPSRRLLAVAAVALALTAAGGALVYGRIQNADAATDGEPKQPQKALVQTSASGSFATDVAIPVQGVPAVRDTLVMTVSAA